MIRGGGAKIQKGGRPISIRGANRRVKKPQGLVEREKRRLPFSFSTRS
jgi:hypothetical protein